MSTSINGRRKVLVEPGPVSLNMVIGNATTNSKRKDSSSDTLSQLEQQVRSIEINTQLANQKLPKTTIVGNKKEDEDDAKYLRYREHEDLLGTVNHEPEPPPSRSDELGFYVLEDGWMDGFLSRF